MAEYTPLTETGTLDESGVLSRHGEFWRNVPSYDRTAEVLLGGEEVVIGGEDVTW
jgi:hypothetical protein